MSDLQSKTDEELNVMLAALLGWKPGHEPYWIAPDNGLWYNAPYFCSSLHEVAKVEAGLTDEQQHEFLQKLFVIVENTAGDFSWKRDWRFVHSTARQRTIALISTLQP